MFGNDFHTCMFACFLSQEEPKRYIKLLKIQIGLKPCKKIFFNSRCRNFGSWLIYLMEKESLEEGIDYEEVFALIARIKSIRLFLVYASFMSFMVYQMDVKSAFLYGTIEEEVYVCQPLGFEDPDHPDKVYKVVKALYGLHQALRAWYKTLATYLLENGFQRGTIDQTLFIKKQKGDILLVQIYVDEIVFDSDYAGVSLDKKSTTGGCQFFRCRLISWQCKKQTFVATSSTKAEYVAAASCCAQVQWIQNQLMDYG
nr:putative ribonuclease H-like domain-containing protein [Tanacetum cinerariifolium]